MKSLEQKWKDRWNNQKFFGNFANFFNLRKAPSVQDARREMTKTKEQLEEEKKISLSIRIKPLDLDGMSQDDLVSKANELWETIVRLETEKYDLEERQKRQDYDVSFNQLKGFNPSNKIRFGYSSWKNWKKGRSNSWDKRPWRRAWIPSEYDEWFLKISGFTDLKEQI